MKMQLKFLTLILFLALWIPKNMLAQESQEAYAKRTLAVQEEESKISVYINQKLTEPFPEDILQQFKERIEIQKQDALEHSKNNNKEVEFEYSGAAEQILNLKKDYYRDLYFKSNPKAKNAYLYTIENSGSTNPKTRGALNCTNGNINTNLAGFNLSQSTAVQSGTCGFIPQGPTGYIGTGDVSFVTNGNDPILGTLLTRTNGGSAGAARVGSTACLNRGRVNVLSMPFTTTMNGFQSISFSFALVLESPSHLAGQNPFFVARVINTTTGVEENRFCVESTPNNPFFTTGNFTDPGFPGACNTPSTTAMQYTPWICAALNFTGNTTNNYAIEFLVGGCTFDYHFGYAYIDDICFNCTNNNNLGSLNLLPTDTCQKTMTVCANYVEPMIGGNTGTIIQTGANAPTLTVLQNGNPTVPPIVLSGATINTTTKTICFNVTPATFGTLNGGFDFKIMANFQFAGGIVPLSDIHSNPGVNNDYTTNPCCACGTWSNLILTGVNGTSITPAIYTCGTNITNRVIRKNGNYQFRFKFNCSGTACTPTYTFVENVNGNVTSTLTSGGINIVVNPNQLDCGPHNITVTPNCGGINCLPCSINFTVVGCDTCVDPVNDTIVCDPISGKPIISFCIQNIGAVPVQYFGITIPNNIPFTTIGTPLGSTLIYTNPFNGMRVYKTASPIPVNGQACTFRFRIDGGVYKGQQVCLELKSFTLFDASGNFLNCCIDPIPLCFTIPDCVDDCADIVNASITCNTLNQRVLSYRIKNNTALTLGGYESHRLFNLPTDDFAGFFSVAPGATSNIISHIIPNTIASGSTYCFTNTVHWYVNAQGHACDDSCFSDTLCLVVPFCGDLPSDTTKGGGGSTIGGGLGKLVLPNQGSQSIGEHNYSIYPNPADGFLYIESPDANVTLSTIRIQDLSGRIVYLKELDNSNYEKLDIHIIPKGVYIVTINNERNYKLIKN